MSLPNFDGETEISHFDEEPFMLERATVSLINRRVALRWDVDVDDAPDAQQAMALPSIWTSPTIFYESRMHLREVSCVNEPCKICLCAFDATEGFQCASGHR